MHTSSETKALIVIPLLIIIVLCIYGFCKWLKYKINYDPKNELNRPLIQPPVATNLERTMVLVRDVTTNSGLVGKVIQRLE